MTLWRSNATDDVAPIYYLRAPFLITIIKTCQHSTTFTHSQLLALNKDTRRLQSTAGPFITRTLLRNLRFISVSILIATA